MKNSITISVIVMWFGLSSSVVNALSPGSIDSDFVDHGTIISANFGNDSVTSSFIDHFTFNATPPMLGAGSLSVVSDFSLLGFDVHLDSLELWDVTTSTLVAPGLIVGGEFAGLAGFSGLSSGHDYDIIVMGGLNFGHTSGGYAGNISILPVPEPEIYVMLLIGLCMVYFAARGRQKAATDYL